MTRRGHGAYWTYSTEEQRSSAGMHRRLNVAGFLPRAVKVVLEKKMSKQNPAYLVASSFMQEGHGSLEPYGRAVHPLLEKVGGELLVAGARRSIHGLLRRSLA